ncbi:hypothetical protein ACQKP8_27145 [Photobacterium alginatilyticum]|uniref:hypothetical protein n=1 Tax=Photobacterium alginatilyticum TaxID=1775171 RepID=UPI00406873A1
MKKIFEFDPLKSFVQLPILWVVVSLITIISSVVFISIIVNTDLIWSFDANGFNLFLSYFKVPLSILALIIPIVALLAANHRSEQTREQIRISNSQNSFSNHYKHIEEFEKYLASHLHVLSVVNIRKAQRGIFPNTINGDFSISDAVKNDFDNECYNLMSIINQFSVGHKGSKKDTIVEIELSLRNMERNFCLNFIGDRSGSVFEHNGIKFILRNDDLQYYFESVRSRIRELAITLQFDQDFLFSDNITKLVEMDISVIDKASINSTSSGSFALFESA